MSVIKPLKYLRFLSRCFSAAKFPWRNYTSRTGVVIQATIVGATMKRRRFQQTISLEERLQQQAEQIHLKAEALPPGEERDRLLREARNADTAAHINDWLSSPGLQPPK